MAQKRSLPKIKAKPDDPNRPPVLIGYARVSMADQNPQLQKDALLAHGVPEDRIYFDQASGSGVKRPEFDSMMADARAGDIIVVWKLDRLGRSVRQVLETFAELDRKGAAVRVLTQSGMDTTTPMGRLIVTIMAAVAEMERDLIRERTRAGLLSAKERGRIGGLKKLHTDAQIRAVAHMAPVKAMAALTPPFKSISGYLKRLDAMRTKPDGT